MQKKKQGSEKLLPTTENMESPLSNSPYFVAHTSKVLELRPRCLKNLSIGLFETKMGFFQSLCSLLDQLSQSTNIGSGGTIVQNKNRTCEDKNQDGRHGQNGRFVGNVGIFHVVGGIDSNGKGTVVVIDGYTRVILSQTAQVSQRRGNFHVIKLFVMVIPSTQKGGVGTVEMIRKTDRTCILKYHHDSFRHAPRENILEHVSPINGNGHDYNKGLAVSLFIC